MDTREQKIYDVLKEKFNTDEFRSSQKDIILHVLDGKHSLVLMPTGMGKSLCYQLPALILDGLTIVISPLISLMKDQVDQLLKLDIDAAYINSTLSKGEREKRYRNIKNGKYRMLYVSPERFRKKDFIDVITSRKISLLAVDEVHCVSQWGNDFRPDYSRIDDFREMLGNPVTIALTATATEEVRQDIISKSGIAPDEITVFNEGICRPNLSLNVIEVIDSEEKYDIILEHINKTRGSKIIYFNLISSIEKFAAFLDMKRKKYDIYHGKLGPERRRDVQKKFIESPEILMLATNAFGMGIDKPDIRMIIHAEIPEAIESYYQEIGRAGRDGKDSECLLMYSQDDLAVQISFLEWKNPDAIFIKSAYNLMQSMEDTLNSYTYEDLQEKLVFKNRGDHRLQTVLNVFDRHHVTEGSLDTLNLKVVSDIPEEILSDNYVKTKQDRDKQRLIDMLNYVKTEDCRRKYIHEYFGMKPVECGNCDICGL